MQPSGQAHAPHTISSALGRTLHLGELNEQQRDLLSRSGMEALASRSSLKKGSSITRAILALQSCKPWYNTPNGDWAPSAQAAMDDAAEVLGLPVASALGVSAASLVRIGTVKATS
eukprot:2473063-Amphidinium_carterae.1